MMKVMRIFFVAAVVVTSLSLGMGMSEASLLLNGNFDSPEDVNDPYGYGNFSAGATLGAWTVVSGNVDLVTYLWQPPIDGRSVDLDGDLVGAISQSFATTKNQKYRLTFYLAGNPYNELPTPKYLGVSVGDKTDQEFTFDVTGRSFEAMGWIKETLDFTALSSSTTLTFASKDIPNSEGHSTYGPAIGNVDVSPVPLPPTLILLGSGLVGLIGLKRKFLG